MRRTFGREDPQALREDVANRALAAGLFARAAPTSPPAVHEIAADSVKRGV